MNFLGVTFGFVAMLVSIVVLLHMLLQSVKELTMFSKGEKVESSQVIIGICLLHVLCLICLKSALDLVYNFV